MERDMSEIQNEGILLQMPSSKL